MFQDKRLLRFLSWAITGIVFLVFIILFVKLFPFYKAMLLFLGNLLAPFLVALFIAYLLYPVVMKINQYNIPKSLAILIIYITFFGGLGYLIYQVYPLVIQQLGELKEQLPQLIEMYRGFIYSLYEYTAFLPENVHDKMDELINNAEAYAENLITTIVKGFTKIVDIIVFVTVVPVLVFYFLNDLEKLKNYFKKWIPVNYRDEAGAVCQAIDQKLGGYLRGQFIVSAFVSLAAFIVFTLFHIKYTLILAIILGITNIIPYFGPIIGAVPAVAITAMQSSELVIIVIISIFAIQVIEGNLLSPYIVGRSINIHPVAIIFVLLLGSELGGVLGMIVSVPLLTIVNVIVSHVIASKRRDN